MSRNLEQHQGELDALITELADAKTLRELAAMPDIYGIALGFFYGSAWEMDGPNIVNIPSDHERTSAITAARLWVSQGNSLVDLLMPETQA
jgi:hypothetical protein